MHEIRDERVAELSSTPGARGGVRGHRGELLLLALGDASRTTGRRQPKDCGSGVLAPQAGQRRAEPGEERTACLTPELDPIEGEPLLHRVDARGRRILVRRRRFDLLFASVRLG